MKYLLLFLATFAYVTLRAFQQRNVAHNSFRWVPPTSYAMAVLDIYVIASVAKEGFSWTFVLINGTAGALGCLLAMWFHRRFVK